MPIEIFIKLYKACVYYEYTKINYVPNGNLIWFYGVYDAYSTMFDCYYLIKVFGGAQ